MADEMTQQEVADWITQRLDRAIKIMKSQIDPNADFEGAWDLFNAISCLNEIKNCFSHNEDILND